MSRVNWSEIRHFPREEFLCPCCGQEDMDPHFVRRMDAGREATGFPWVVTSGWRCERHNAEVGGHPNSYHVLGLAADVALSHFRASQFLNYVFRPDPGFEKRRFPGIGINQKGKGRFVHIDDGPERVWTY